MSFVESLDLGRNAELVIVRILFFHHAGESGVVFIYDAVSRRIPLHGTVRQSHSGVCVRIRRLAFLPFEETCRKCLAAGREFHIGSFQRLVERTVLRNDSIVECQCRIVSEFRERLDVRVLHLLVRSENAVVVKV